VVSLLLRCFYAFVPIGGLTVLATDDLQRKAEEFRRQEQEYQERVRQALAYYYDHRVEHGVSVQKAAKRFNVKYAAVRDLKNKTEGR
jgi:hypothetical protein